MVKHVSTSYKSINADTSAKHTDVLSAPTKPNTLEVPTQELGPIESAMYSKK